MAHHIVDFVLETATVTGTGNITTSAAAVAGYRVISAIPGIAVGDTFPYTARVVDSNGSATGNTEVGIATITAISAGATTFSRSVQDGSNGTSPVNFTSSSSCTIGLSVNAAEYRQLPTRTLASDYTNSTTTVSSLTGMTFDAEASADYEVEVFGEMQSAATTTGIGLCLAVPTGSTVSGIFDNPAATTQTDTPGWTNASGVVGAKTSGVPATGTSYPLRGKFHVRTSTTAGTVTLEAASEVASSQVTIKAGFMLKVRRFN